MFTFPTIRITWIPEDMWSPYKQLYSIIEKCLKNSNGSSILELDICLKKNRQNFSVLLRNPPKNEHSRNQLKNGMTEGVSIPGHSCPLLLSTDLVTESLIISDMFDLDEYLSTELLCTAQRQLPQHPGLTRGLVAVLLYYDGRKAIAYSLRDLFQATVGVSWITDVPKEITHLISSYTQSLVDDYDILSRIIDILEVLDIKKETELLTKNRAFGSKKHRQQILELFKEIRLALATAFFNWSAQKGLPKNIIARLIQYFSNVQSSELGKMDDVMMTMLLAYLYAIDTSLILRQDDSSIIQNLPVLNDHEFTHKVYELITADKDWGTSSHLHTFLKFAFGLTLASLREVQQNLQSSFSIIIDRDEELIDASLSLKIFDFIYYYILENDIIFKCEFFYRRIHIIFTDFIVFMHSKITELRGRADETARTVMCFTKEGLEPPANLDHNFEMLMFCIGKFYKNNRAGLSLCVDYWGSLDISSYNSKITTRSVSLFKFIRLAGELLPQSLFVPYLEMIAGLSSCEKSARNTFNLLKQSTGLSGSATLSWEHFFGSLARYYANLRQEHFPGTDTVYKNRILNRIINPQEIEGLCAVLSVIQAVATYDEIARIAICEHPNWAPIQILLGLLTCSVPINLKAKIADTLSALAKTKDTAIQLWNNLEASQIIFTSSNTNSYHLCNLETEIEQTECRTEMFPFTQSILEMLYTLVTTTVPKNLGVGIRENRLSPYLTFVINGIFLKFYNRNYKDSSEKWAVGEKCLRFLYYLLKIYEINPEDFMQNVERTSPPGFHIMLQLHTKSDFLRQILLIIDEAVMKMDEYSNFSGKEGLEDCALFSLKIIEIALSKQNLFFNAHSMSNSCILLSGLSKLLMDVNPRSRRPDHLLITTMFIMYSSWLPHHALLSVKILTLASRLPNINSQILDIFTQSSKIQTEIRNGFVECLECELIISRNRGIKDSNEFFNVDIELQIKEAIITLLQSCLTQPPPNLTHFLLGSNITKESNLNQMQKLSALDSSINCTKSLICLLDNHLEIMKEQHTYNSDMERIIEKGYHLLYALCANQRTSDMILRYLRNCNDFLCRHLSALPLNNVHRSFVLNQMRYILKCTAIELKQIAHTSQISRFQHLCQLLMGFSEKTSHDGVSVELNHYLGTPINASRCVNNKKTDVKSHMLLCNIIDCLEFQVKNTLSPNWDFFESSLMEKILTDCETTMDNGEKLINIKKVHDILNDELCTVQSSIVGAQRQVILQEIKSILSYALKINGEKNKSFASIKLMKAWGQVTEMLFTAAPDLAIPVVTKQEFILEILQKLLSKVVPIQPIFELAFIFSGTILLLLVNLKYCNYLEPQNTDMTKYCDNKSNTIQLDCGNIHSNITAKSQVLSLKFILRNILEWIIISEVSFQKLRINLYAGLLYCMRIIKGTHFMRLEGETNYLFLSRTDHLNGSIPENNQIQMTVEVLKSFGEKLLDVICHDCIVGHDICKMSALSCIETILDLDSSASFINYIANRGYLSHIIESLSKSDDGLCRVLHNAHDNMRALYVYESKMAVLLRISSSHMGAELLLGGNILEVLSAMQVFDMHPDVQGNNIIRKSQTDEFIPYTDTRYRQILFPALNICESILSTLGPENHCAISQVLNFLLSHCDIIETILRCGTPLMELGLLKELSEVTGLIARTTHKEFRRVYDRSVQKKKDINLCRIRHLMLSLFSRFIINGTTLSQMFKSENVLYEPTEKNKSLHMKYFLEISSNLSLYCRNAISQYNPEGNISTTVLFSPNLADSKKWTEEKSSYTKITQSLQDILSQLKGSVEYHNRQKLHADNLLRQRTLLTNLSIDAKAQATFAELTTCLKEKQNELLHCSFITEQCLYLLWRHLDFYMNGVLIIENDRTTFFNDISESKDPTNSKNEFRISTEDVKSLRKILISVFNETFSKHLIQSLELNTSSDSCFAEALLRRIKFVIQFYSQN